MLPLSRVLMLYSSGSSVESVEQPCRHDEADRQLCFVCRRCRSQRYRVRQVPGHFGEKDLLRMQWFRGVYEKHLD